MILTTLLRKNNDTNSQYVSSYSMLEFWVFYWLFSLRTYPNVWGIYIFLIRPKLAFVRARITVKFTVVSIYTYVLIFIRTYYPFMCTYEPIYVPRLSWYVDTYICFIYTYLYQCTTYMYVSDDPYILVLCWYINR